MLTFIGPEEGQYKDLLTNMDDQVWKDLSDDWQKNLSEKEESPAL